VKKDNEELLVEANELLRKELEEARAELAKRATSPVLLAYATLLAGTVGGSIYMAVVERSFLPLMVAVFGAGWIGDHMRAMAGHPAPRAPVRTRRRSGGIRIDIGAVEEGDARESATTEPAARARKKARG
jgi:hypothetical protein